MDIKRLEELYAAVFPYPWAVSKHLPGGGISIVCPMGDAEMGTWMVAERVSWEAHADMIVALRNALPEIIKALKELQDGP